ncbi:MAG TPA: ABC transporter ATP-binding protein [Azospirillum sp.]|nr:ABC transporter ATP-binding protein [Azospirillum sp.]
MPDCLRLDGVSAGYADTVILEDVSVAVPDGGTLAVLGRNGVGKTTLLATVMGHTTLHGGRVTFQGRDIAAMPICRRVHAGIGYVPQEREIFHSLTVEENLTVGRRSGDWTLERVYDLFPRLAQRRRNMGNHLSGGEQQMLAVGRALMGNPRLLLMDEPLEGLAPVIVDMLMEAFRRLREAGGLTIVLVEQHASVALDFAETAVVLDRGRVVYSGASQPLRHDPARLAGLFGMAAGEGAHSVLAV